MSQPYTAEFKKKIVRLHEEEGRTIESIMSEYGVAKSTIARLCKELREECQKQAQDHPEITTEFDFRNREYIFSILKEAHIDVSFTLTSVKSGWKITMEYKN